MDLHGLKPPLDRLARKGDARDTFGWREWDPDYVREFGLAQDDVPALLELARLWSNAESLPDEEHLWSAPIHAWRAGTTRRGRGRTAALGYAGEARRCGRPMVLGGIPRRVRAHRRSRDPALRICALHQSPPSTSYRIAILLHTPNEEVIYSATTGAEIWRRSRRLATSRVETMRGCIICRRSFGGVSFEPMQERLPP